MSGISGSRATTMAPRENIIVPTSYPDRCLPFPLQNRNILDRDRVTLEDGRVELERRTWELSGFDAHLAQLFATYPIRRPWENELYVIARLLFEFADVVDLASIEASRAAEVLVGLVKLAKSHEWCLDSPSPSPLQPRANDNRGGSSWRIRAECAMTCRPYAPIGHRYLFSATYRKCYDVREDSFTHCCVNKCSRKVTRKRADRKCWRGTVELDEKCKFCFAREHSARCEVNLACRCACLAYNYDMMWTPIGEGTFEYSSAHNRTASYVDSTTGGLIMPRDIVDVFVNMGFATVGAHSSFFLSARNTTPESVAVIDDDDDDDVEKEADTGGRILFLVNGIGAVLPLTSAAAAAIIAAATHAARAPSRVSAVVAEKYVNVMIRCCACLFTVSLSNSVDWEKLNRSHGEYCPPCAFVRTPPLLAQSVLDAYKAKFAFVHALSYSACTACACNYIAPSTFK